MSQRPKIPKATKTITPLKHPASLTPKITSSRSLDAKSSTLQTRKIEAQPLIKFTSEKSLILYHKEGGLFEQEDNYYYRSNMHPLNTMERDLIERFILNETKVCVVRMFTVGGPEADPKDKADELKDLQALVPNATLEDYEKIIPFQYLEEDQVHLKTAEENICWIVARTGCF